MAKKTNTKVNEVVEQVTEAVIEAPVATAQVKVPNRYEIRKTKLDALAKEFHERVEKLRREREELRLAHKKWISEVYEPARQAIEAEFFASRKVIVLKAKEAAEKAPEKVEA